MKELQFYNKQFENAVRHELLIYDRPITEKDALLTYDLDCSDFTFDIKDCRTLCAFKNLDRLDINVGFENLSFLQELINLEELYIEFYQNNFNFSYLVPLQKLRSLTVSCGDISNFELHNFEELTKLSCLESLALYKFGTVDLAALKNMSCLTGFYCAHGNKVLNSDSIAHLVNLKALTLIDITVENLDFLNTLSSKTVLALYSVTVLSDIDIKTLQRFEECDLDKVTANGKQVICNFFEDLEAEG